jgi:hypothetical protein
MTETEGRDVSLHTQSVSRIPQPLPRRFVRQRIIQRSHGTSIATHYLAVRTRKLTFRFPPPVAAQAGLGLNVQYGWKADSPLANLDDGAAFNVR